MSGSSSVRPMPAAGALPRYVVGLRLGSLNLASDRQGAFDDWTEQLGLLFAAHAAVAVDACRRQQQLAEALSARDVNGQAKGIMTHRNGVSADAAYDAGDDVPGDQPEAARSGRVRRRARRAVGPCRLSPVYPPLPGPGPLPCRSSAGADHGHGPGSSSASRDRSDASGAGDPIERSGVTARRCYRCPTNG